MAEESVSEPTEEPVEGEVVDDGQVHEGVPDEERQEDFYRRLRARWEQWMKERNWPAWLDDVILFVPDFFYLLVQLFRDQRVGATSKIVLGAGITYYVWPLDFVPDALGPIGFVDDLLIAALVLDRVLNLEDPEIAREHWPGDGDVIEHVQRIVEKADDLVGRKAFSRLVDWLAKKTGSPR